MNNRNAAGSNQQVLEESSREQRIAKYKEERRRQLRDQFQVASSSTSSSSTSSSGIDGLRTTRAYRLRVAANAANNSPTSSTEKRAASISSDSPKADKDKSSKRKSHLNRAPLSPQTDTQQATTSSSQIHSRRRHITAANSPPCTATTIATNPRKSPEKKTGLTPPSTRYSAKKSSSEQANNASKSASRTTKRLEELRALTRATLAAVSPSQLAPVSILKRAASEPQEAVATPPVTFSPNVIDRNATNRNKQGGILKKRRSLDECQVLRRRSCSPQASSILKEQRRSSLEEITRMPGILKSRSDDGDASLNSPQSILKRRSGGSSVGSASSQHHPHHHHVSITTAVILAAAEGAEMVLEPSADTVRPILKKKSISEEGGACGAYESSDLKPILKKKSSTETDETEERPTRPILKNRNKDKDEYGTESGSECDVRRILKTNNNGARPRLSFCERSTESRQQGHVAHLTSMFQDEQQQEVETGAKRRTNLKRDAERWRTQPVTVYEYEASLNYVHTPHEHFATTPHHQHHRPRHPHHRRHHRQQSNHSDYPTTSSDHDLNSGDGASARMSDSAFQSLADGLELDDTNHVRSPKKFETNKLAQQMRAIALEAKSLHLSKATGHASSSPKQNVKSSDQAELPFKERLQWFKTKITSRNIAQPTRFMSSHHQHHHPPTLFAHAFHTTRTPFNTPCILDAGDISPIGEKKAAVAQSVRVDNLDEGISSDESESDTEEGATSLRYDVVPQVVQSTSDNSDESSGGREIQRIICREAIKKTTAIQNIEKSRSTTAIGDEPDARSVQLRNIAGVQKSSTSAAMQSTISELQARLQHCGENDWRKRTPTLNTTSDELLKVKNLYNEELSCCSDSILKTRKDELDASAKQWKSRVEKTDADSFSVAGRMRADDVPLNILPSTDKIKRSGNESPIKWSSNSSSTTSSNDDVRPITTRTGRKVTVLTPNDETFTAFFKSIATERSVDTLTIDPHFDFDILPKHTLLVHQKKRIQVQKRKCVSRNPLRALAARDDIRSEYTEVLTGVAEREAKRLNVEKISRNSHLSVEALAGLASTEDFKSVALRKATSPTTGLYLPFRNKMLLQIKGRRHVQTRLVEPIAASINDGDNFVLITSTALYNFVGAYANVIEQNRAAEIINHIQRSGEMGCKADRHVTIVGKRLASPSADNDDFCRLLDADNRVQITKAGHPDEDEVYETGIIATNMIYTLSYDRLVPVDEYWGSIPKVEMLQPTKVYVFDFGSEMYVWSGKNADANEKKMILKLAKELWDGGYNYTDSSICPMNVAQLLGARTPPPQAAQKCASKRPEWAMFAKVTQHRETILFREKFLDWPDYARLIRVKDASDSDVNGLVLADPIMDQIKACDAAALRATTHPEPNFEVEGSFLGRGRAYYDETTRRQSEVNTITVDAWKINENTYEKLVTNELGHFYDSETYIVRWKFRVSVVGRELSGKPSKHLQLGRDRCVYFSWLGEHSSVNEKGTTALFMVELDSEHAKQIRIMQGSEPPHFLQLFNGNLTIHRGKKDDDETQKQRLFVVRGELRHETQLVEVGMTSRSLRSRASFVYMERKQIILWHGCKVPEQTKSTTSALVARISKETYEKFNLPQDCDVKIVEEGEDDGELMSRLGEKPDLYLSLKNRSEMFNKTPRLYHFSSISGKFEAMEVLCPHRSNDHITAYPFLQNDLYNANQPALFLFDNDTELWLWQGWWPDKQDEVDVSEQTGSGPIRWQAERRAAMQTALDYAGLNKVSAYLVWAGLEPIAFTNLFPSWTEHSAVTTLNSKSGMHCGEMIPIEEELSILTRSTYSLAELLERPLPVGVDPTQLEMYLSPDDFREILHTSKEEFQQLPLWKQTALKKEKGLF